MLDKVIAAGNKSQPEYRVRNKIHELVPDEPERGALLWQAFAAGETFMMSNALLFPALSQTTEASPVPLDEVIRALGHAAATWKPPGWPEEVPAVIDAHADHAALLARVEELPADRQQSVRCILGLSGTGELTDGDYAFLASVWREQWNHRKQMTDRVGDRLLPPVFWREVLALLLAQDPHSFTFNWTSSVRPVMEIASAEQMMALIFAFKTTNAKFAEVLFECHPDIEPLLAARGDAMLKDLAAGEPIDQNELDMVATSLVHGATLRGEVVDARFDPLLGLLVSCKRKYGAILQDEHLLTLPQDRLEPIVLRENPPDVRAPLCPTPAVLGAWLTGVMGQSGAPSYDDRRNIESRIDTFGDALAPVVAGRLSRKFTRRNVVISKLMSNKSEAFLPTLVGLLDSDAKTRREVSEGLKTWGAPVIPYLAEAPTWGKKARSEAAAILSSLGTEPDAMKLASTWNEVEKDAAIQALLNPLVRQYEALAAADDGDGVQLPRFAGSDLIRLDALMRTMDSVAEIVDFGPDVVDELGHWICEYPRMTWESKFWHNRKGRDVCISLNAQRLVYALARTGAAADLSDADLQRIERFTAEEDGGEQLADLGLTAAAVIAEGFNPESRSWPITGRLYEDTLGERTWSNVKGFLGVYFYFETREERDEHKEKLEDALAAVEEAVRDPSQAATHLGAAVGHLAEFAPPLDGEGKAAIYAEIRTSHIYSDYMKAYGPGCAATVVQWLQENLEDVPVFRTDVVPFRVWQTLVALVRPHVGPQEPVDKHRVNYHRAPELTQVHIDGVLEVLYGEDDNYWDRDRKGKAEVDYQAWKNLEGVLEHFEDSVDLAPVVERIVGFLLQRAPSNALRNPLQLVREHVLSDDKRSDEDRAALVERLTLSLLMGDEDRRMAAYSFLEQRVQAGCSSSPFALETLVAGFSDKSKKPREQAGKSLMAIGLPALPLVYPVLASKKITPRREAAGVVLKVPSPDSVPFIEKALAKEKKADIAELLKLAELACKPLGNIGKMSDAELDQALQDRSDNLPAARICSSRGVPTQRWSGGAELSPKALAWILVHLARVTFKQAPADLEPVIGRLDHRDRDNLARHIPIRPALRVLAVEEVLLERAAHIDRLARKDVEAASALIYQVGLRGSDAAVRMLGQIRAVAKRSRSRNAARWALNRIARQRDVPVETLIEEALPTYGLDGEGRRSLQVDDVAGTFTLTGAGTLVVHVDGDEVMATEVVRSARVAMGLPELVEQITTALRAEEQALDDAMVVRRTWSADAFQRLFLEHPIRRTAARGLVFADEANTLALITSDGLVDRGGKRTSLEGDIHVVHPVEVADADADAWATAIDQTGVASAVAQWTREVFDASLPENQLDKVAREFQAFESGRECRRSMFRMGFTQDQLEGLVYEGVRAYSGGAQVTVKHDGYSLNYMNDREFLEIREISFNEEPPASLVSEVIGLLRRSLAPGS